MADTTQEKQLTASSGEPVPARDWKWGQSRDPLSPLLWPLILIWAGVVFLVDNLGWLNAVFPASSPIRIGGWPLVLIGAGMILVIGGLARYLVGDPRRSGIGNIIFGLILVAIGLGNTVNSGLIWPLILIALGLLILLRNWLPGRNM